MKFMRWLRYPLLFIAVIFIPIRLTIISLDVPIWFGFPNPYNWSFAFGLIGYAIGYLLIYMLLVSTAMLFGDQILSFTLGVIFIGFPWLSVQGLLLHFFRAKRETLPIIC